MKHKRYLMILLLHAIVLLFGSVASTIVSADDDDDVYHQTMVRGALSSTMLLGKSGELSADLMEHIIQDTHTMQDDDDEEVTSLLNRVLKGQSTTQVNRATAQQRHRQKLKRRQSRTTKKKKAQTKETSGNLLDNGGNTLYYTPPTTYNNGRTKQSMNTNNVGRVKQKQGYKKKGKRIPSSYKKGYKKQSQQNIGNNSRPNNNTNRPNNSGSGTFQQQQDDKFLTMKNTGEGCLQSTNPYRTCLSSDGTSIVHTYSKPQISSNEEIVQGTMYLSLLQDSTPLSCNTNAVDGYAGVNTIEQMEELTLSYLADNVGYGRTGFGVVCVQVEERVYDESSVQTRNSSGGRVKMNGGRVKNVFNHNNNNNNNNNNNKNDGRRQLQQREVVESNTLKLRVSYVQKIDTTTTGSSSRNLEQQEMEEEIVVVDFKEHEKELSVTTNSIIETKQQAQDVDQRSLQQEEGDSICTPLDRAQCCSQYSINNSPGQYCTKLGCNVLRCGTGRERPRRSNMFGRHLIGRNVVEEVIESNEVEATNEIESVTNRRLYPIPYSLKGSDYTTALRRQTVFNPKETWAQLDVENIENVAVCSVNRYSVEMVRHL